MTKKAMAMIDPNKGLMQCRVCGECHYAMIKSGGRLARGSWQCKNGCKPETDKK